ncbi:MAG: SUMF1/EgtB/PvdO family nonheme iron enzyme [Chloroflexi bacterium]|nr:SUMF1/EgtB/PvdO family nonheme iron enzyme [Chloroflexota bacterium]
MPDPSQPAGLIPDQLLSNIKKGDCVLFLGADLPLGYAGAPLSRPELAAALAQAYDLPTGYSWPETAQAYLGKRARDRNGLITFVAEHSSGPDVRVGPIHQAIARGGFRAIVTAWYDELLERALSDAGYRVDRVVRDKQLPYVGQGTREVTLIKLYGCLSDPESLVLGQWDHAELMGRLSRKLELVTSLCVIRPPLFVGFDLTAEIAIQLYVRASANMAEHMKRAFAVWPDSLEAVAAVWADRNVEFRRADAAAFLEALASQLPVAPQGLGRVIRVHRPPYKFLDYYEAADADIFCGRDTESQIVARLALSHRLLTLFGPSGAGKTSLLLAGVLPRLAAEGYGHVYVRALDDPLPALCKAVATRAGRTSPSPPAPLLAGEGSDAPPSLAGKGAGGIGDFSLRAFFEEMLAPNDKLIVVLDQFEELFLRVGSSNRSAFFHALAEALIAPTREVRVIFSLREDTLPNLDEARGDLPDIFTNSYRLTALDRGNARLAITEPAARASVLVETALVDALVGGEGRLPSPEVGGGVGGGGHGDLLESGHVPPAVLQIVLDRLYRGALPPGHPEGDPPPAGLTLTLAAYRAIRYRSGQGAETQELTGAEAILASYVHQGLARLPELCCEDRSNLGADPALGREILKAMVTSQRTKAALTHDEIVSCLNEAGAVQRNNWRDQARIENTRLGLERVRLLRSFERDGVALYELAHDHLAREIATWITAEELAGKMARELLRRGLDDWRSPARLLLRAEVLALIHEHREELKRLTRDETELLLRSALATGYEVPYWFQRACTAGVAAETIASDGLGSASFRTRAAAVTALSGLGERFADDIIERLVDDYPQVRVAAIASLERLRPDGAWRKHLKYECYVPAGEFIMGEDKEAHRVTLDAFYIGKYPITNTEYQRFMADRGRGFAMPAGKERHPVVSVDWYSAKDYAEWAGMRLLTEAQWGKAASWEPDDKVTRGQGDKVTGKKRKYPWGDTFDNKYRCNIAEAGVGTTTPVGKYSSRGDSPCGCADIAGNVWEWCSSQYKNYPYRADDGREDLASSASRVVRGGSFFNNETSARCAARGDWNPYNRYDDRGLRVGWAAPSFGF